MLRTTVVLGGLGLAIALALAAVAGAAPPVLVSAGHTDGRARATWTLPDGGQTWTVEVARSTQVDADGYFPTANVVDSAVFMDGTTSWASDVALAPGTYYLHVSAQDTGCAECPLPEWSQVLAFTVAAAGSGGDDDGDPPPETAPAPTTPSPTTPSTTTPATTTPATTTPATTTPTTTTPSTTTPGPTAPAPPSAATNAAPRLAALTLRRRGRAAVGSVRACDDAPGSLRLEATARRGRAVVRTRAGLVAPKRGCRTYRVWARLPRGAGRVAVRVRVRDAAGAWSRALVRGVR